MKNKKTAIQVILWIARIWGSLSLIFLAFFLGAHLMGTITGKGEAIGRFNSLSEVISFTLFPISTIIGLGVAWKWEGLGGLITIAGIMGFHLIRPDINFNIMIDGLALPGLFYILYWYMAMRLNFK